VGLLAHDVNSVDVVRHAAAHDVEVVSLQRYARSPLERDGLQLGFAAVPPAEIARGLQVLARLTHR
jgi:DNA-binding transcriptional MocR family regulator